VMADSPLGNAVIRGSILKTSRPMAEPELCAMPADVDKNTRYQNVPFRNHIISVRRSRGGKKKDENEISDSSSAKKSVIRRKTRDRVTDVRR